ncbi:hypothetical protein AVEN_187392-1, partial [Araneus ventricosus]
MSCLPVGKFLALPLKTVVGRGGLV